MLQGLIVKKILDVVMKTLLKKYNLDNIKAYVENDNELDVEVRNLKIEVSALKSFIKKFQ